jgi:hypothetical protein
MPEYHNNYKNKINNNNNNNNNKINNTNNANNKQQRHQVQSRVLNMLTTKERLDGTLRKHSHELWLLQFDRQAMAIALAISLRSDREVRPRHYLIRTSTVYQKYPFDDLNQLHEFSAPISVSINLKENAII